MQYQEVGQQKEVMPAYMEAYGHGDLSRDYKNGKADCDLFGMGGCQAVNGTRTRKNLL